MSPDLIPLSTLWGSDTAKIFLVRSLGYTGAEMQCPFTGNEEILFSLRNNFHNKDKVVAALDAHKDLHPCSSTLYLPTMLGCSLIFHLKYLS